MKTSNRFTRIFVTGGGGGEESSVVVCAFLTKLYNAGAARPCYPE